MRIVTLLAIILTLVPVSVWSANDSDFSIGPSLGYVSAKDQLSGTTYGLDLSYIFPSKETAYWVSGGIRSVNTTNDYSISYVEAGGWFLANLGLGYSYSFGNPPVARNSIHGFIGIPIPLFGMSTQGRPGFYIEPYYRPTFGLDGENKSTTHEFGILIKYTRIKLGAGSNPKVQEPRPNQAL